MNTDCSPLLTDLYELTMLQAYLDEGMADTAVFEFFVRALPPSWNFLMAAGIEQAVDYLATLRFRDDDLRWLRDTGRFHPVFLDWLGDFRFAGDVYAMREGTVFFPDEPVLRVVAPLAQAQFVESRLINLLNYSCLVASKAARCVLAAPGRQLVDFGLRRAHGAEAGLLAARSSYLAGFAGTATVLAGRRYGIPLFGTMAHSYIQAHDREAQAFSHFSASHPRDVTLLVDTYDSEAAAAKVAVLAPDLRQRGVSLKALRLDSGDLAELSRRVRAILDQAGLAEVRIFASGNLDEREIARLVAAGAPIDGFGVGTHLSTSADAPYLDSAYKLQVYAGKSRRKRSPGKATWPGEKQVYRVYRDDGRPSYDVVALACEPPPPEHSRALLHQVMHQGRREPPLEPLDLLRHHADAELALLPAELRRLDPAPTPYQVQISAPLRALAHKLDQQTH
ncbi:nicotinate phosphoribosyltransferase [Oryzomicrobium sp.]|uniref:nicotinate phosphoribosyltransferase n=1 Tax=Oryzomicrobium sp. TaxID=1911578 RepID=UPI002FDFD09F